MRRIRVRARRRSLWIDESRKVGENGLAGEHVGAPLSDAADGAQKPAPDVVRDRARFPLQHLGDVGRVDDVALVHDASP